LANVSRTMQLSRFSLLYTKKEGRQVPPLKLVH
jgi:hypothetical protein